MFDGHNSHPHPRIDIGNSPPRPDRIQRLGLMLGAGNHCVVHLGPASGSLKIRGGRSGAQTDGPEATGAISNTLNPGTGSSVAGAPAAAKPCLHVAVMADEFRFASGGSGIPASRCARRPYWRQYRMNHVRPSPPRLPHITRSLVSRASKAMSCGMLRGATARSLLTDTWNTDWRWQGRLLFPILLARRFAGTVSEPRRGCDAVAGEGGGNESDVLSYGQVVHGSPWQ